jgi:hypothetical protein
MGPKRGRRLHRRSRRRDFGAQRDTQPAHSLKMSPRLSVTHGFGPNCLSVHCQMRRTMLATNHRPRFATHFLYVCSVTGLLGKDHTMAMFEFPDGTKARTFPAAPAGFDPLAADDNLLR